MLHAEKGWKKGFLKRVFDSINFHTTVSCLRLRAMERAIRIPFLDLFISFFFVFIKNKKSSKRAVRERRQKTGVSKSGIKAQTFHVVLQFKRRERKKLAINLELNARKWLTISQGFIFNLAFLRVSYLFALSPGSLCIRFHSLYTSSSECQRQNETILIEQSWSQRSWNCWSFKCNKI